MARWFWLGALIVSTNGCGKKWPPADLAALDSALECGPVRTAEYHAERCRMVKAFMDGEPFDTWPTGDALDVWFGRSQCVGQSFISATARRIKRGSPRAEIVRINGFQGFDLHPYVVNEDSPDGDFAALQKAVIAGPPFDAETIAAAKKPPGKLFFPLAPTENSVGAPNEHWRSNGDRLIAVTSARSPVQCAVELWKLP